MIKIKVKVNNLKTFEKKINAIEEIITPNEKFYNFMKNKFMMTLNEVMSERLVGGTTNDFEIDLYKNSNYFEDTQNGFILYNNAKIPADKYNILPFDTSGYPNGEFSIALAFEYGTGINNTVQAKVVSKSKNRRGDSWYLPKNVTGKSGVLFDGYSGFEIYRYTADKINQNISKWYNEYIGSQVR